VALEQVAARAPVPVQLTVDLQERLPEPIELAAYFVACEALANVGKYAQASAVRILVVRRNGLAVIEIADDGVGGADDGRGSGLRGLADRVEALGGRLQVVSPIGSGTSSPRSCRAGRSCGRQRADPGRPRRTPP
jgi:signal transduction histidine kinase